MSTMTTSLLGHDNRWGHGRVPTLYEEFNSPTFPDHARNFSLTKLTCNSYFSLHFSRLLLPYTDSLCYHYHIYTTESEKAQKHEENNKLSALTLTSSYFALKRRQKSAFSFASYQNSLTTNRIPWLSMTKLILWLSLTFQVSGNPAWEAAPEEMSVEVTAEDGQWWCWYDVLQKTIPDTWR